MTEMGETFMKRAGPPPSYVNIKNEALFNSLFQDDNEEEKTGPVHTQNSVRSDYLRQMTMREEKAKAVLREKRFLQHKEKVDRQMMDNSRKVKERIAEIALKKEDSFKSLRNNLVEGRVLATEVGKWLKNNEEAKQVKKKKQYDTWNAEVYGHISEKINTELGQRSYKQIHSEKLKHFDKFLDVTNAKGSVFRDIIIESEYDPLIPNRNCIKVKSERIKDPIKRAVQRTNEEKSLPLNTKAQPRETLDVLEWATGKIEATPHGFFAKMMSGDKPRNSEKSKTMASKVAESLDQYNISRGREVLDKEFPRGKGMKLSSTPREDFLKDPASWDE